MDCRSSTWSNKVDDIKRKPVQSGCVTEVPDSEEMHYTLYFGQTEYIESGFINNILKGIIQNAANLSGIYRIHMSKIDVYENHWKEMGMFSLQKRYKN